MNKIEHRNYTYPKRIPKLELPKIKKICTKCRHNINKKCNLRGFNYSKNKEQCTMYNRNLDYSILQINKKDYTFSNPCYDD